MYGDTITLTQTRDALAVLRERGITTVEVSFSGGNDEGGADGFRYLNASGEEVKLDMPDAYEHSDWDPNTRSYGPATWKVYDRDKGDYRPATDDEVRWAKVAQVLEAPIYDRWGSFAGEFYVNGTVVWDVAAGTHKMSGQESVQTWESFEY